MTRTLPVLLLLAFAGLYGCASSPEEEDSDILLRARLLFKNFTGAYDAADYQAVGAIRNDFRRLNAEGGAILLSVLRTSKNEDDQGYAAFALGFSDNRAAVQPLVDAVSNRNETIRGNAIVALGNLGFPDIPIEPFVRLMKDPNPQVRQAALFGLGLLPLDRDSRGLHTEVYARFSDPDWPVRSEALIACRKMKRPDSVTPILDGPMQDREPLVRANAALALGAIGRDAREATPFLIEMLKDSDHRVVDAAWTALNRIHDKDFDRSYSTWRDWFEDEQKIHYICPDHKEVSETGPGKCPRCGRRLERVVRDPLRKIDTPAGSVSGFWICPEHQDVITTTPAKCGVPGCGKELVPKRPDPVLYVCPDHPKVVTSTPAKCGVTGCGKDLLPQKP